MMVVVFDIITEGESNLHVDFLRVMPFFYMAVLDYDQIIEDESKFSRGVLTLYTLVYVEVLDFDDGGDCMYSSRY